MTSIICPLSTELTAKKLLNALDCLLIEHFTIQDKTLLEKLLTSLQNAGKWFYSGFLMVQ